MFLNTKKAPHCAELFYFYPMRTFIQEVLEKVCKTHKDIQEVIFILPSKRAGTFLKKEIAKITQQPIFSPTIYSIESFVEDISKLKYASSTEQLFELYKAYLAVGDYDKESFDSFLSWGQTLLQDFNEIDRYLIDERALFSNLRDVQEINHWSSEEQKTPLIDAYLHFWDHILPVYETFNNGLLEKGLAHQGLAYRKAVLNLSVYLEETSKSHIFIGFNALNKAESTIIQETLARGNSEIFWDIDPYFLNDPVHDAGFFIRAHKDWNYFEEHPIQGLSNQYLATKKIEVIGVPKNISQTKYAGTLLAELQQQDSSLLKNTALILGDETLLEPLLHGIPETIPTVNITMGQKLQATPLAGYFTSFFELHQTTNIRGWFFKDFLQFITHPYSAVVFSTTAYSIAQLVTTIKSKNWSYITLAQLASLNGGDNTLITTLFQDLKNSPDAFMQTCQLLIATLKDVLTAQNNTIALEQLYKISTLFNQITELRGTYSYITTIKGLRNLFKNLLSSETLDFQGNPLDGLQVMGMLESRNLDFETVIITSVNEGILPSGKSNNSFIPFDLKLAYKLPTYKEKDAVYTYHFYRLLQRAKNVYLLYNTEPDVLEGGERSRLIAQLIADKNRMDIIERIASPTIIPIVTNLKHIEKTPSLMAALKAYAAKGFSPSSLSNYIRNPIDFYKQNVLGVSDVAAVEEQIEANTFGTVVHDSLEDLYTPFVGDQLTKHSLELMLKDIDAVVVRNLKKSFKDGAIDQGKNYISYRVIKKYIEKFILSEIELAAHHTIRIIALEKKLAVHLDIPGIDTTVILKGKLDRIDELDGVTRIIDYKTGKVEKRNVEILGYTDLITEYQFSKAFQLLCYAYMFVKEDGDRPLQAGIISLKNLQAGTMLFAEKEGTKIVTNTINEETLAAFEAALQQLIKIIFDPELPFIEKEV